MELAPRPVVAAQAPVAPAAAAPGVTEHAHDRVVIDAGKATFKVVGDKLEPDAPIAKVTTQAGEVLEAVHYDTDKETAKAIDPFTWKPKGHRQCFIRKRHVIRPQAGPVLFSRTPNADTAGTAKNAEKGGAVRKLVADKIINRVTGRIADRIPGVSFNVVETFDSLPAHIKGDAAAQDTGDGDIKGAYYEGVVYLILDAHKSAKDLEKTIFHELHGHVGLSKLYGNHITSALDNLFTAVGAWEGRPSWAPS